MPPSGLMDAVRLFGENVRKVRLAQRLTQQDLAAKLGMERSYLSELERGRRNPTIHALGRLADALGVDPWTLLKVDPGDGAEDPAA